MQGWIVKCNSCKANLPTVIIVNFGFDKDGMLSLNCVCRLCFRKTTVTHTVEEIVRDIEQDRQAWMEEHPLEGDFMEWESEF